MEQTFVRMRGASSSAARPVVTILAAMATLIFIVYFSSTNFLTTFRVDDDQLYYGLTGLGILQAGEAERISDTMRSCIVVSDEEGFAERTAFRFSYLYNYPAVSLLWGSIWTGLGTGADGNVVDAAAFSRSFYLAQLFAIVIVMAAVLWRKEHRTLRLFSLSATVVACALLSLYVPEEAQWLTRSVTSATLQHVLSAPDNFNLFNFSPRGMTALALLALVTLRWTGRLRTFYAGLLGLCFVHQSNATMAFFVFLGVDLLLRQSAFRDFRLLATAALTLVVIALREELFALAGAPALVLVGGAMVVLISIGVALGRSARYRAAVIPLMDGQKYPAASALADIILITAAWILTLPFLHGVIQSGLVDAISGRYLFWQLHSRLGSLLLPSIIGGVAVVAYGALPKRMATVPLSWGLVLAAGVWATLAGPVSPESVGSSLEERYASARPAFVRVHQTAESLWAQERVSFTSADEPALYYSQIAALLDLKIPKMPIDPCD